MNISVEYVQLKRFGCGGTVRLGKQFLHREILRELFAVNDIVIVDDETLDETLPNDHGLYELDSKKTYTVADEEHVQNSDDEEISSSKREKLAREFFLAAEKMRHSRISFIQREYKPLHCHVYKFEPKEVLTANYLSALKSGNKEELMKLFCKETDTGCYSSGIFVPKFCDDFLEEILHFERSGMPMLRPNSMNNYGVVLEELGFESFFDGLLSAMKPAYEIMYGNLASTLDYHHAFIVQYKIGEDLDLDFHYDDSEVTLNLCLGKEFTGGSLYFRGLYEDQSTHHENFEYVHHKYKSVVHIGKHRHGANCITSGERYNLIVWWRSSCLRNKQCTCCGHKHP